MSGSETVYSHDVYDSLFEMQRSHFWYQGRHRFLLRLLLGSLKTAVVRLETSNAIDIGGGCGGWCNYLVDHGANFKSLTLAEHSRDAIELARRVLPTACDVLQFDLQQLSADRTWDVIFMLDVLEHLADDADVLSRISDALNDNGVLLISVPAMKCLWSDYDVQDGHHRRYSPGELRDVAERSGLEVIDIRYFSFFLFPMVWLSRKVTLPGHQRIVSHDDYLTSHKVPNRILNWLLTAVFSAETPLGHWLRFPFGSSLAMVARRKSV